MQKALRNQPTFEPGRFSERVAPWKSLSGGPGSNRVVVEWSVGKGPSVFVYPAARRAEGFDLLEGLGAHQSDERWADFLEFEYVPQVVEALKSGGHNPQVICVDLRPVQTMRARRRALEAAAREKAGGVAAHH
jgi:hypothetical protein